MADLTAQLRALTPAEVATTLQISEREVRRLIRIGRIPALVVSSKCIRVYPAVVEAWARQSPAERAAVLARPRSPHHRGPTLDRGRIGMPKEQWRRGHVCWVVDAADTTGCRHRFSFGTKLEAAAYRLTVLPEQPTDIWHVPPMLFRFLAGPVAYVFRRSKRVLYVGRSAHGIARAFNPRHHALRHIVRDGTETLTVYACWSPEDAQDRERELITLFRPLYNGGAPRR